MWSYAHLPWPRHALHPRGVWILVCFISGLPCLRLSYHRASSHDTPSAWIALLFLGLKVFSPGKLSQPLKVHFPGPYIDSILWFCFVALTMTAFK